MKRDYFDSLIERYKNNKLTPEEKELMEGWLADIDYSSDDVQWQEEDKNLVQSNIQNILFPVRKLEQKKHNYYKIAAVVSVLIFSLFSGGYFYYKKSVNLQEPELYSEVEELIPTISNGVLIDESGENIQLNTLNYDSLYHIDKLVIKRVSDNEVYILPGDSDEIKMNQIFAPKGGGFTVRFEDNSRVTLNANSSITFPSRFSKDKRVVNASGEVFFDIVKDMNNRPFVVNAGDISVNVLGTKFNILHKKNGVFKASLFQGLIEVNHKNFSEKITPGKELSIDDKGNYTINDFNTPSINAWKRGYFSLDNKNIKDIMEELQDWYDVEVVFDDIDPNVKYKGSISKFSNIETILDILSLAEGNTFEVQERRVIVR